MSISLWCIKVSYRYTTYITNESKSCVSVVFEPKDISRSYSITWDIDSWTNSRSYLSVTVKRIETHSYYFNTTGLIVH